MDAVIFSGIRMQFTYTPGEDNHTSLERRKAASARIAEQARALQSARPGLSFSRASEIVMSQSPDLAAQYFDGTTESAKFSAEKDVGSELARLTREYVAEHKCSFSTASEAVMRECPHLAAAWARR